MPPDQDGNKYIQIVVDACIDCTDVKMVKIKGESAASPLVFIIYQGRAIIRSLSKLQCLFNRKAKRLHTDGAKEQNSPEVKAYLDSKGIEATHTASNALQSNSFAKRQFRQIMAATRSSMTAAPHMPQDMWSFAVLEAADRGNYSAKTKDNELHSSPNAHIKTSQSPGTFLPWGKLGKVVSAVKFQKTLDARANNAC